MTSNQTLVVGGRSGGDNLDAILAAAPWQAVKGMNDTSILDLAALHNIPRRIFRVYGTDDMPDSQVVAVILQHNLTNVTDLQLACESSKGTNPDWLSKVIAGVKNGGYRGNFLIGNFAVGNPDFDHANFHADGTEHYPDLGPILALFDDPQIGLGYDGYVGVGPRDPRWSMVDAADTIFRYQKLCHCAEVHGHPIRFVAITETGRDQAPPDRVTQGGYAKVGWTADDYAAFISTIGAVFEADPRVIAVCHFTINTTQDWVDKGFLISPEIVSRLASYVNSRAVVAPLPAPPPAPPPIPPVVRKKGHSGMPAQLFQFDQGPGTYDCWVRCIESFFLRYGYTHDVDSIFQAGKGYARPAGGEPASFSQVKQAITTLAAQDGVQLQLIDLDNPGQVSAALMDPDVANPWTVIAGVGEQALQPGQNYGHYIILKRKDGDTITVVDSYAREDGNQSGQYSWEQIINAMVANWDPVIDAIGAKLK